MKTYEQMVSDLQEQLVGLDPKNDYTHSISLLIVGVQGACWCAERIARAIESTKS